MEGLIPMVFKAIKEKKKRSQYRCLSVGAAETDGSNLLAPDFYYDRDRDQFYSTNPVETRGSSGHRRYGSTGGYGINGGYGFKYGDYDHHNHEVSGGNYKHNQQRHELKRFGSHRMFSCITGAT